MIAIRDLKKSFGSNLVLDGISLDVGQGEVVCIIGASGSGKSTLLRCINLLETIDDGTIHLDGQHITDPRVKVDRIRQRGIVLGHAHRQRLSASEACRCDARHQRQKRSPHAQRPHQGSLPPRLPT